MLTPLEHKRLRAYGLKDQDYSLDAKGNPRPTPDGISRAGYVPWRYLAQHPWVYYQADIDGFAKASHEAEMATIPLGVDDPTNGFLAPTLYKLASTKQPFPPFHDVVAGGNRHFDAGPGWDYSTGLGSPDVWNLGRDIVKYLKAH